MTDRDASPGQLTTRLWLRVLCMCTALGTGAAANAAPPPGEAEPLLSDQTWQEQTYGVSLRPPLGSKLYELSADDAVLRIVGDPGYSIKVSVKQSSKEITLAMIRRIAIDQLGTIQPQATILGDQVIRPAGLPGSLLYFRFTDNQRKTWVLGQAFVQLNPNTVLVLQLDIGDSGFQGVRPIFEAVVNSVNVQDVKKLDEQNEVLIEAGQTWYETVEASRIEHLLVPEQWFRIVHESKDVGYMRIRQHKDSVMQKAGLRVDIQARVQVKDEYFDSLSNFFVSDDRKQEIWSIRTTRRPAHPGARPAQKVLEGGNDSWVETGLRDDELITVTRQHPGGRREHQWKKPPTGYLSQVEVHLLPAHMLTAPEGQMGFYAYFPTDGKVTLRTEHIQRGGDAVLKVTTKPAPGRGHQVSHYDSRGGLVKRELPDGRTILPATFREISARWKIQRDR